MQKATRYFLIAIASMMAVAMTLALSPVQVALTVHSGLSSEHSEMRSGDVVSSRRSTILAGPVDFGTIAEGSGFGGVYIKRADGRLTYANGFGDGAGLGRGYTLLAGEVQLVGVEEDHPVTIAGPTAAGFEFVWFQDG